MPTPCQFVWHVSARGVGDGILSLAIFSETPKAPLLVLQKLLLSNLVLTQKTRRVCEMRHKKIRKCVLLPKWHLIFYWPKQLYALCPLSDSRLMLVGVV